MEAPIKRTQSYWDGFFLRFAAQVATLSKDPDRQVGAVLTSADRRQVSYGYNGFPEGMLDLPSSLADRDFKNANMIHAEANCLSKSSFNPTGGSLYITRFPCFECATKVAESGVARVVVSDRVDFSHPRWGESWARAEALLLRRGIYIIVYNGS